MPSEAAAAMSPAARDESLANGHQDDLEAHIRFIPIAYRSDDSNASALRLVTALRPDWAAGETGPAASPVEFVRFTDGITNTLLKAVCRRNGASKEDMDREAILLRAYGNGTDLIIDRHRETQNHELLMRHGLAPELLARFENGMMYRFLRGTVTQPEDLRKPPIYRAVARRLAQWHVTVPCIPGPTGHSRKSSRTDGLDLNGEVDLQRAIDLVAPGKPSPNVWTVMQKWIYALPTDTEEQRKRQATLQQELIKVVGELSQRPGLGKHGLVFAHCDLLSGNVIVQPRPDYANGTSGTNGINGTNGTSTASPDKPAESVSVAFIDYEYATPSPAAFDIANHFAEWGGFDCDFSVLPTRSQRRDFIRAYMATYIDFASRARTHEAAAGLDLDTEVDKLMDEVDAFRGVPGFYWGIWALIQATISQINFDYASYAETRLGEYWAWRAETDGSRAAAAGKEMPLRERRWAQEV